MVPFFLTLILLYRKHKKTYLSLILLQLVSFFLQFVVGNSSEYNTFKTVFNIVFINFNLFLIIAPWNFSKFTNIWVKNDRYFNFLKRILDKVLLLNFYSF
jgi:hypothetical protein